MNFHRGSSRKLKSAPNFSILTGPSSTQAVRNLRKRSRDITSFTSNTTSAYKKHASDVLDEDIDSFLNSDEIHVPGKKSRNFSRSNFFNSNVPQIIVHNNISIDNSNNIDNNSSNNNSINHSKHANVNFNHESDHDSENENLDENENELQDLL